MMMASRLMVVVVVFLVRVVVVAMFVVTVLAMLLAVLFCLPDRAMAQATLSVDQWVPVPTP